MPQDLIHPIRIYRKQIQDTRLTHIYIYGTDRRNNSYKGQCAECIGEPNAFPIYTKWRDCSAQDAFFYDHQFDEVSELLHRDCLLRISAVLLAYPQLKRIVFPKLGEGCSNLKFKSPKLYDLIYDFIRRIGGTYPT